MKQYHYLGLILRLQAVIFGENFKGDSSNASNLSKTLSWAPGRYVACRMCEMCHIWPCISRCLNQTFHVRFRRTIDCHYSTHDGRLSYAYLVWFQNARFVNSTERKIVSRRQSRRKHPLDIKAPWKLFGGWSNQMWSFQTSG